MQYLRLNGEWIFMVFFLVLRVFLLGEVFWGVGFGFFVCLGGWLAFIPPSITDLLP